MLARFNTALLVALVLSRIAEDTGQRFFAVAIPLFGFGAWVAIDGRRVKKRLDEERR
jgi:hypothetical protein